MNAKALTIKGVAFVILVMQLVACTRVESQTIVKQRAAAILLTKAADDGTLLPFRTIRDESTVTWFSKRLNDGQLDKYNQLFGTVFGPQIFVDAKGEVIAATVCRMPENVVCLVTVEKTSKGYILRSVSNDVGISDKEYVQKLAAQSGVKSMP